LKKFASFLQLIIGQRWRRKYYVVINIEVRARFFLSANKRDWSKTSTLQAEWSQFAVDYFQ